MGRRHAVLRCPRSASADRFRASAFPVLDACWISAEPFRACRIAPASDRIVEGRRAAFQNGASARSAASTRGMHWMDASSTGQREDRGVATLLLFTLAGMCKAGNRRTESSRWVVCPHWVLRGYRSPDISVAGDIY